jgi:hypothetical protein
MSIPLFWLKDFELLHKKKSELFDFQVHGEIANFSIPYSTQGSKFKSPGLGTFGGIYASKEVANWPQVWSEFLEATPSYLEYEIIFPPFYFSPEIFSEQIYACIEKFNPKIMVEINQHVNLEDNFAQLLSKGNKKKIRQFQELGGLVRRGVDVDLDRVINVLEESRRFLGVKLSMSRNQIIDSFEKLPNIYSTYIAEVDGSIAAAAIVVRINSEVLYVLYWGDDAVRWRHLSPVAALYTEIFRDARKLNYKFLDLGISSLDGEVNTGLRDFKKNLGCVESPRLKVTFQKPISLA